MPLNAPLDAAHRRAQRRARADGAEPVVDIERNVITELDDGIAVDALVVTLLAAAGDDPLGQVRLGHAEVSGVACGAAPGVLRRHRQRRSTGSVADIDDPGCHTDGDARTLTPTTRRRRRDGRRRPAGPAVRPTLPGARPPRPSCPPPAERRRTAGLAAVMAAGALACVALRRRLA